MNAALLRRFASLALLLLAVWGATQALQLWSARQMGHEAAAHAKPGDIQMISSVTCVYCAKARAWFTEQGIPFSECFVERDSACAAQYQGLLAPGTPVIVVRGQPQVGFSSQRVLAALKPPQS
ncbi:MAG: glutaredoxin family protein [Pseudorhodobacter sp.]|nr:glutaredoxin family protein [Rhizobacter sp.]